MSAFPWFLFLLTAREGGLWADRFGRGKTRHQCCLISDRTVAVLVSLETDCSVHGSCLTRRRWLPFIAPLTVTGFSVQSSGS
jgi:hypothetical protein